MLLWRLKRFFILTAAVLTAVCAFACVRAANVSKFPDLSGERTYYLHSASSQALQKHTLSGLDMFRVKGESVRLDRAVDEAFVEELAREYDAEIVLIEEACGVVSYYGYTPAWKDSVCVAGKTVNLHIAVKESACVVGSPVIFGGF